MPPARRPAIHAYIHPDTHDSATEFAALNGVSITGLLEAIFTDLAKQAADAGDATEVGQDWVKAARKIDAAHRSRSRT